jgi:ADP-ribosyl-[dinitrogen reductase] hydrolase
MNKSIAKDILFGTAVGDALGVPVEFQSRISLIANPVKEMMGFGTHYQPLGTWSDDSSLTFCLADSLCNGYDLTEIATSFVKWYEDGFWTPLGEVFDIGITTHKAIINLKNGVEPVLAGESSESSNGNGSLMRILPLMAHINGLPTQERFKVISEVSSITHSHPRSVLGCILLLEYASYLQYHNPKMSLFVLSQNFHNGLHKYPELQKEMVYFKRLFDGMTHSDYMDLIMTAPEKAKSLDLMEASMPSIASTKVDGIKSSGYVVETLEASIWCLINSSSYEEAVLLAVNLGGDTDTTGAVTGGLAGIFYGYDAIPKKWIDQLARKDDIKVLADKLDRYYINKFFAYRCPICETSLNTSISYPNYICNNCTNRAKDIDGRKLIFFNLSTGGGYGAKYIDTNDEYLSHECFINGIKCWADEAKFGGIVIEKIT